MRLASPREVLWVLTTARCAAIDIGGPFVVVVYRVDAQADQPGMALRVFAGTVRERLRQSDVLGRTGDEEFGLILPGTDLAGAQLLVERIRQSVEAMPLMDERARGVHVTLSAGIAVAVSDDELAPEQLYGRADKALYAAKRAGRNRVALYGSDGVPAFAPLTPSSQRGTLSN